MKLIRNVEQKKPFSIVYVQHPLTDDMNDDGEPVVQVLVYKRAVGPITSITRGMLFKRGHWSTNNDRVVFRKHELFEKVKSN